ncbi:unnamed protein product [Urochloa humidicola]
MAPRKQPLADDSGFSWLTALGFMFLTFNSITAIYRSKGDRGAILFVVVSYLDLVLLFLCLRLFERGREREQPNPWRWEWLKACVWGLTTLLTVMFSHDAVAIMSPLVALVVWSACFIAIGGGFSPPSSTGTKLPR